MGVRESSGALSYTLGDGKYVGYHVDVCENVLRSIRKQLGLSSLTVRYQLVTSQNRIPLVQNGTVDLECGSTTNNVARQKDVAFAVTTFVEEVRIAVKANSGIRSINQLNGKSVATTTGTTSVQLLRRHERASGVDFKEVFGKDHADSFLLLESGRADAFVMDGQILAGSIAKAKNPADFKIVGEVLAVEPIAIVLRKDDPAFKKAVDDSLVAMMKSGELAKLWDKWFMLPIPPSNTKVGLPVNAATKAAWAQPNDKPAEDYLKK
jgi:glutamate/aspartate transport system substrate-binding protein